MIDHLIYSKNLDPYYNLALENSYLRNTGYFEKITLLLWSSVPSVVMGRFQNPWMECYLKRCQDEGLKIVRRQSGGGTVYIDEGNLNFSFIGKINKEENFKFTINLLEQFGIKVEVNERNDILYRGKKISGSAFKNTKDSKMHHFSLLVDTDPKKIPYYLFNENSRFTSKSIPSKRSPVDQLPITVKELINKLEPEKPSLEINHEFYAEISEAEWVYGETPKFEVLVEGELVKFHKGKVTSAKEKDLIGEKIYEKSFGSKSPYSQKILTELHSSNNQ